MFDIRPTASAAAQTSAANPARANSPRPASVPSLLWGLASPQERVRLLRHHHALGVLHKLHRHSHQDLAGLSLHGSKLHRLFARHPHGFAKLGAALRAQAQLRRELGGHALAAPAPRLTPIAAAPTSAPAAPAAPAASSTGSQGARTPAEAQGLAQITQQFQARFTQSARDPAAFNALLKQAFGDHFDAAKAEGIRQQALAGDFSWMPKIQLADPGQMRDLSGTQAEGSEPMGCYVKEQDTVLINRELLARDPSEAEKTLAEEMGHAIDARINTSDAAGDEGDIFSKLVHGEAISASQMAEMKADNDHGLIDVGGKKVEVEYRNPLKRLKKALSNGLKRVGKALVNGVKNSVKAAMHVAQGLVTMDFSQVKQGFQEGVDAVKDTAKEIKQAVKDTAKALEKITREAFQKLLQSKLFNAILMVAHFIPVLNTAALIIDAVKAAYMVYQGIKYKSLSMVLAGVASLASSAAGISTNYGFNGLANTLTKVGNWASNASQAYNAIAKKDLGAALGLMGMDGLSKGVSAVQAAKNGDTLGALATAATVGSKITGSETLHDAGQVLLGAKAVHELEQGHFDAAHGAAQQMDAAKAAQDASVAQRAQARAQAAQAAAAATQAPQNGDAAAPEADDAPQSEAGEGDGDSAAKAPKGPKEPVKVEVKRGQTLEGLAREHYGADWRAGLAQMAMDNNLQANRWGSPMLREGQDLVIRDLSERSDGERQMMNRAGGQVVARNQQGLVAKGQMEAQAAERRAAALQARQEAASGRSSSGPADNGTPQGEAWSFKEASAAQRRADDAKAAASAANNHREAAPMSGPTESSVPKERSTYDRASTAVHIGLSGLGMVPVVGAVADVADLALTSAEYLAGKSNKLDLGLATMAVGANLMPLGGDQAADLAKIAARTGQAAESGITTVRGARAAEATAEIGEASSSVNATRLRDQLVGQEISGGHAFEKHVIDQGEFNSLNIQTREQFANHIEGVLSNPTSSRQLSGGRSAYWQESTGTVVIRNPRAADGGTAFQPTNGRAYFDSLR